MPKVYFHVLPTLTWTLASQIGPTFWPKQSPSARPSNVRMAAVAQSIVPVAGPHRTNQCRKFVKVTERIASCRLFDPIAYSEFQKRGPSSRGRRRNACRSFSVFATLVGR